MSTAPDTRLQPLLNRALARGDYTDVQLVLAQMSAENVARYNERCLCPADSDNAGKPHVFKTTHAPNGLWPEECACIHCGKHARDVFCRKPLECCLAGRCAAEFCCND